MASTGLMIGSAVGKGMTDYSAAYADAQATRGAAQYNAKMYELNANLSEVQARDSLRRGEKEATQARKQGKQLVGAQRAALAAQGIEIDSGSALEIQEDTAVQSKLDALTLRNNAYREAWGFRVQAQDLRGQAAWTRFSGETQARNTLLTGGIKAFNGVLQAAGSAAGAGGAAGGKI